MDQAVNDIKIKNQGFAAVLSVIILSAVVLAVLAISSNLTVNLSRMSGADFKGLNARSLASACAEVALQAIFDNTSFTGSNNLSIGSGACQYTVSNTGGTTRQIIAEGSFQNATRRLTVNISGFTPSITISGWQENP